MWMGAEHVEGEESPLFVVTSTVEIAAPAGGGVGAGGEFSGVVTDGVEQWGMDVQGGRLRGRYGR